jgi:hypothetical protein
MGSGGDAAGHGRRRRRIRTAHCPPCGVPSPQHSSPREARALAAGDHDASEVLQRRRSAAAARGWAAGTNFASKLATCLHVIAVASGYHGAVGNMLKNVSDAPGRSHGDGFAAIELCVVPIHLGQRQDLLGKLSGSRLCHRHAPKRQRSRDIEPRIGREKIDTSFRCRDMKFQVYDARNAYWTWNTILRLVPGKVEASRVNSSHKAARARVL